MGNTIEIPILNITNFRGYRLANELEDYILEQITNLPKSEKYNIATQILRSSNSICESVKVGEGMGTLQGKSNQYSIAIGSAHETVSWAHMANKLGFFDTQIEEYITQKSQHIVAILTKILQSLVNQYGAIHGVNNVHTPNVKNMIAFKKGVNLLKGTYHMINSKKNQINHVHDLQIRKAVCSILANLAESNVLYINNKKVRLNNAKAAIVKLQHHFDGLTRRKIVDYHIIEGLMSLSIEIHKMINAIYSNLLIEKMN